MVKFKMHIQPFVFENKSMKKIPISYSVFGWINDFLCSLFYLPSIKQYENFKQQQKNYTIKKVQLYVSCPACSSDRTAWIMKPTLMLGS